MSEFKFACPVCGQHITADHSASGSHIECPTCFTKLVVPVSRAGDSKLIYSAARVSAPAAANSLSQHRSRSFFLAKIPVGRIFFFLALAAAVGGGGFWWKQNQRTRAEVAQAQAEIALAQEALTNKSRLLLKCGIPWNANPTNVSIPDKPVFGVLNGKKFSLDRATLQGGTLGLRQGEEWPPDLALNVLLFARRPENLAEKTIYIWPDRPPPVPKLVLRWKEPGTNRTQDIRSGYAMKVIFGTPTNGIMPGGIYISLPEQDLGVIAGTFEAEIRKPAPPRPKPSPTHSPTNAPDSH